MRLQRYGAEEKLLAHLTLIRRMRCHQMSIQLGGRFELHRTAATYRCHHFRLEKRLTTVLNAVMRSQLGDACTTPAALATVQRKRGGCICIGGPALRFRYTNAATVACPSDATVAPMSRQCVRITEGLRAFGALVRSLQQPNVVYELSMLAQVERPPERFAALGAYERGIGGGGIGATMRSQVCGELGTICTDSSADGTKTGVGGRIAIAFARRDGHQVNAN